METDEPSNGDIIPVNSRPLFSVFLEVILVRACI